MNRGDICQEAMHREPQEQCDDAVCVQLRQERAFQRKQGTQSPTTGMTESEFLMHLEPCSEIQLRTFWELAFLLGWLAYILAAQILC